MNKVIVAVTNDLSSDRRVQKVCEYLCRRKLHVILVGRKLSDSKSLKLPYSTHRFSLFTKKGPLFYASYNLRLLTYLLLQQPKFVVANDLDTLLASYFYCAFSGAEIVYDSHEFFTEVPELIRRPFVRRIWLGIEKIIFPYLKNVCTVNHVIAGIYARKYHVNVHVVRNIPPLQEIVRSKSCAELQLPVDKKILILQGAWINVDRGGEEAVQAMQFIDNCVLLIIGAGDVVEKLKEITVQLHLEDKIKFYNRMAYEELKYYTAAADLGLSLDKPTNLNYKYSLPNKLFDYIHAGTPVVVSDLPLVVEIVKKYNVGVIISSHQPKVLANCIMDALNDKKLLNQLKNNCIIASTSLNWQEEEKNLEDLYSFLQNK